jgi:hypothetical protein
LFIIERNIQIPEEGGGGGGGETSDARGESEVE